MSEPAHECQNYDLARFKKSGLVLIIAQEKFLRKDITPRIGTEKDIEMLTAVFQALNFEVRVCKDKEADKVIEEVQMLSEDEAACDYGSLVISILTHGNRRGYLHAKDKTYHISEIIESLKTSRNWEKKPKLFFVQACRCDYSKNTNTIEQKYHVNEPQPPPSISSLPHDPNFIIFFSTVKDQSAYRTSNGSWFIQELCPLLYNLAQGNINLISVLTAVNKKVTSKTEEQNPKSSQTSEFVSFFPSHIIYTGQLVHAPQKNVLFNTNANKHQQTKKYQQTEAGCSYKNSKEIVEHSDGNGSLQRVFIAKYNQTKDCTAGKAIIYFDENHETDAASLVTALSALGVIIKRERLTPKLSSQLSRHAREVSSCTEFLYVFVLAAIREDKIYSNDVTFASCAQNFEAGKCAALRGKFKLLAFIDNNYKRDERIERDDEPAQQEVSSVNEHADFLTVCGYGETFLRQLLEQLSSCADTPQDMYSLVTRSLQGCAPDISGYVSHFRSSLTCHHIVGSRSVIQARNVKKGNTLLYDDFTAKLRKIGLYNVMFKLDRVDERKLFQKQFIKRHRECAAVYSEVLETCDNPIVEHNKALALALSGQHAEALTLMDSALVKMVDEHGEENSRVLRILGDKAWVQGLMGYYDKALELYERMWQCRESNCHADRDSFMHKNLILTKQLEITQANKKLSLSFQQLLN